MLDLLEAGMRNFTVNLLQSWRMKNNMDQNMYMLQNP
jgi:hypothetical protein